MRTGSLIDSFVDDGEADLRKAFASRLTVLVMLDLFGLPESAESLFRPWYNTFEAALANHARLETVRARASHNVEEFHRYFQGRIEEARTKPTISLLNDFLSAPGDKRLSDAEVRRNVLIIFFGGVSTVEAITLSTLWAFFQHEALERVKETRSLIDAAIEETMRWLSPVQSATRHSLAEAEIRGVRIPKGAIVNCMLASANRDDAVFENPDKFDIDRTNLNKHLGFARGSHVCLRRDLAKEEARAAINSLLDRLPNMRLVENPPLVGHEFCQPESLRVRWDALP